MEAISIVLIFICVMLSAFFSSSEVVFISLQRLRLRHMLRTGDSTERQVAKIAEKPEKFLATILLGNNLVNTAAAALATIVVASFLTEGQAALVATLVVTVLLLIFGEIVPKIVATRLGERLALLYAAPIGLLITILSPLARVFLWIGDKVASLLGAQARPWAPLTLDEIRSAVSTGVEEGTLEETTGEIVHRAILFGNRQVSEVMTPRPDISWIERGMTFGDFLKKYSDSPHSRFPMFEENIDNVVGVLWIKDVLMAEAKGEISADMPLDNLVRQVPFVPESKPIADLFSELQESGDQVAMAVDEFGGISGLITMKALLEEIVGELRDELATGQKSFETIDENTFQIDGGMRIEEANLQLHLEIPEGDYETIAGFILNALGHIPKQGETVKHDGLKMVVTDMKGFKIDRVLVTKESKPALAESGDHITDGNPG